MLISLTGLEGGVPPSANYEIGTVVKHTSYGYRGVVVSFDLVCTACDKWYLGNKTQPDRNQPWYNVLVHETGGLSTYVAQSNLEVDVSGEPIDHPRLDSYFKAFKNGIYIPKENDSGYCSI